MKLGNPKHRGAIYCRSRRTRNLVYVFRLSGGAGAWTATFMHRASASENPSATLFHYLQDSTHISFGLLTTGFTYRWFILEACRFRGGRLDWIGNAHKPGDTSINNDEHDGLTIETERLCFRHQITGVYLKFIQQGTIA